MEQNQIVTKHPGILSGTAVFTGSRVPVASLFSHLRAGDSIDEFLTGFPSVTRAQVQAVMDIVRNDPGMFGPDSNQ